MFWGSVYYVRRILMKIGIVSRHAYFNYGSCLQAYALQSTLEQMGHYAEYVNYIRPDEKSWKSCLGDLKESRMNKNFLTRILYLVMQIPSYYMMKPIFSNAQKKYLVLSDEINDRNKLPASKYDVLCTGSDQVWNRIHNEIETAYFWDNIEGYKISYASSFGKSEVNTADEKMLREMLLDYKHITVRESSGVKILNKLGLQGTQVVDPVMLQDKQFWEKFIANCQLKQKKRYILVYQLHFSQYLSECIEYLNKNNEFEVIYMCNDYKKIIKNVSNKGIKYLFLPSVEDFVAYIHNADFVVTDSFHGTVFSIIFERQFAEILPDTNTARNEDLLELFGLQARIVRCREDIQNLASSIDYSDITEKLMELRASSKEKLDQMLKKDED